MAKPAVIEARKAQAMMDQAQQIAEMNAKLDLIMDQAQQIAEMNAKLDLIMVALKIAPAKPVAAESEANTAPTPENAPTPAVDPLEAAKEVVAIASARGGKNK